jgi:hypothetical protein
MTQKTSLINWKSVNKDLDSSFNNNLASSLNELFARNYLTDVTLVSDELVPFKAHKFVLSAASPVMKDILLSNPHSHPLIYLRGVKQHELQEILNFIYLGEANIQHDQIYTLLDIAKGFELNMLSQYLTEAIYKMTNEPKCHIDENEVDLDRQKSSNIGGLSELPNMEIGSDESGDYEETLNIIDDLSDTKFANNDKNNQRSSDGLHKCDNCDSGFKVRSALLRHKRGQHEMVRYYCDKCPYQASRPHLLKAHQESVHKGVRYKCEKCESDFDQKYKLVKHRRAKHEGVRYKCEICQFEFSQSSELSRHKRAKHEAKHEMVGYSCVHCKYKAKEESTLKNHIKSKHDDIIYACNKCEYRTELKTELTNHKQLMHSSLE